MTATSTPGELWSSDRSTTSRLSATSQPRTRGVGVGIKIEDKPAANFAFGLRKLEEALDSRGWRVKQTVVRGGFVREGRLVGCWGGHVLQRRVVR
eukprot:scaffold2430_cov137-Isochrysis_galbana.AAC.4